MYLLDIILIFTSEGIEFLSMAGYVVLVIFKFP